MLKHTKKIKEMYEDIQRRIFYMIPEKWEKLYLYASVMDIIDGHKTGELFFYYIPKVIVKKNPVNVYEIPQKFNLDEKEYIKLIYFFLVLILYIACTSRHLQQIHRITGETKSSYISRRNSGLIE